jgi:hypothetical protein
MKIPMFFPYSIPGGIGEKLWVVAKEYETKNFTGLSDDPRGKP